MRKIYVVGFVVFGVVALSAIVAASASALESGWLVGGVGALTAVLMETGEEITLDLLVGGILAVAVDCSGFFAGTVGGEDEGVASIKWDLVTEVLNLEHKIVNSANPLSCEVLTSVLSSCGAVGELASVLPVNLPWLTEIVLSGSTFKDDLPTTSGYHVTCPGSAKRENECKGLAEAELINNTSDVIGKFTEATNEETCTEGVGHLFAEGLTSAVSGEPVEVSEEGSPAPGSGWLVGGVGALTAVLVETGEEMRLDMLFGGTLVVEILCSGYSNGTVGGEDEGIASIRWDLITEILNLERKSVNSSNPLSCEILVSSLGICGSVGELASLVPVNLPWLTEIKLSEGTFKDDFPSTSGYHVACPGSDAQYECKGSAEAELINNTTDVIGKFREGDNEEGCTEGVGHLSAEVLTSVVDGESLEVSEGE